LRLKQQYFFVACSIHDILRRYQKKHDTFDAVPDKAAIQLNDTHPAIAVAELMRLLIDREGLGWDQAWTITQNTLAYTNHTLLPEALEKWPLYLFERMLPRHLQIIYEINHRFLKQVHVFAPGDDARKQRLSIIQEGRQKQIRMAHLAVVGSHSVNGVAELHTSLVRSHLLRDFAEIWPERFNNKTNGVTPRRWLLQCNRRLARAITDRIGDRWITHLDELERLDEFAADPAFGDELRAIKLANKKRLATIIADRNGVTVNPGSIFDVQVKRIHEYKRQLMSCLHAVVLYRRLKLDGTAIVPRTVLFGGKAAPGYVTAKKHIKLINDVAAVINNDPVAQGQLNCVFLPNYSVSLAERIIPAADLSEQISMAGKEASGTGNMKFQMNGALTIGTLDGANIEIREEVGADNFFLFGLDAGQVRQRQKQGYHPGELIEQNAELRGAIEMIESGFFSPDQPERFHDVGHYLREVDPYLICADFESYLACQRRAAQAYTDPARWATMVVHNIAHAGKFSSDRTIQQYADEIWNVKPLQIEIDPYVPPT
ncbi:MAG: glycogen/starch/alpha-glucan phosphorylase, partial [Deltaproteobacteria bacterium]|nr:glycogen/starch/alpha-glucan phosphorylase [Deltaproteobacteria bacterium]